MNGWSLPIQAVFGGKTYQLHADYRDILEVFSYLNDPDLPEYLRWRIALALFYDDPIPAEHQQAAMDYLARFISGGEPETLVELHCHSDMMNHLVDRFGENIVTLPLDAEHFLATVQVRPGATFFAWVFQYGGAIRVIWPDKVRGDYARMLSDGLTAQGDA